MPSGTWRETSQIPGSEDGRWTHVEAEPGLDARLHAGDLLLVDEAGMLDQDTRASRVPVSSAMVSSARALGVGGAAECGVVYDDQLAVGRSLHVDLDDVDVLA